MKQEIKCPHCHEWTLWRGHIDDRCLYCGEFLEIENFTRSVEKKIKQEVRKEEDFLFVRPEDSKFVKKFKTTMRPIRQVFFYLQLGFVFFISLLLWVIGILSA
ncbi:hypothetical protein [Mucilaginibacter arboris]|uniref:Uncharacterized protein n=1 Tax=Mucilaginibacter arboris TaxID=2682090 RepID=A0A7K1SYW0_9SPHI|nr:hypothetical protein [Mucilaginibacter arboris]MVN22493.1 hypothetical protein [Mucilaginibacter arboris]